MILIGRHSLVTATIQEPEVEEAFEQEYLLPWQQNKPHLQKNINKEMNKKRITGQYLDGKTPNFFSFGQHEVCFSQTLGSSWH